MIQCPMFSVIIRHGYSGRRLGLGVTEVTINRKLTCTSKFLVQVHHDVRSATASHDHDLDSDSDSN